MNFRIVFLTVFLSVPFCVCQNATGTPGTIRNGSSLSGKRSGSMPNVINAGTPNPGTISMASLQDMLAKLMSQNNQPNPVTNKQTATGQPIAPVQPTISGQPTAPVQPTVAGQPIISQPRRQLILTNRRGFPTRQRYFTVNNKDNLSAFENYYFSNAFGLYGKLKREIIGNVNKIRMGVQASNMNSLLWSEKLAAKAAELAKGCTYRNTNKAAVTSMVYEQKLGDNLVSRSLSRWKEYAKYFSYGRNCQDAIGCQYSQMVWAKSETMGCAAERCIDMTNIVCLFEPQGNVSNELPYLDGEPCTQCSAPQGSTPMCNTDKLCERYNSKQNLLK